MGGLEITRQRSLVFETQPIWIRSFQKPFITWLIRFLRSGIPLPRLIFIKNRLRSSLSLHQISNNLGAAYLKAGQISEAFQSFARALRLNPQHEEAFTNLYNLSIQCPWQRREFLKFRKRVQPFSRHKNPYPCVDWRLYTRGQRLCGGRA